MVANYNAAYADALKKCMLVNRYGPEDCQNAIDTAAEACCAIPYGLARAASAGMALPGTLTGGDIPTDKLDLAAGEVQDLIMKTVDEEGKQTGKDSDKRKCGCQ